MRNVPPLFAGRLGIKLTTSTFSFWELSTAGRIASNFRISFWSLKFSWVWSFMAGRRREMLARLVPPTDWDVGVNCQRLSTLSETPSYCGIFPAKHRWYLSLPKFYFTLNNLVLSGILSVNQVVKPRRRRSLRSLLYQFISSAEWSKEWRSNDGIMEYVDGDWLLIYIIFYYSKMMR